MAAYSANSPVCQWRMPAFEGLRRDVETRREDAASLEADEFAIERAIRERLEYARPGETIVRLRAESDATTRLP